MYFRRLYYAKLPVKGYIGNVALSYFHDINLRECYMLRRVFNNMICKFWSLLHQRATSQAFTSAMQYGSLRNCKDTRPQTKQFPSALWQGWHVSTSSAFLFHVRCDFAKLSCGLKYHSAEIRDCSWLKQNFVSVPLMSYSSDYRHWLMIYANNDVLNRHH